MLIKYPRGLGAAHLGSIQSIEVVITNVVLCFTDGTSRSISATGRSHGDSIIAANEMHEKAKELAATWISQWEMYLATDAEGHN